MEYGAENFIKCLTWSFMFNYVCCIKKKIIILILGNCKKLFMSHIEMNTKESKGTI